jgi:hypothetical protein
MGVLTAPARATTAVLFDALPPRLAAPACAGEARSGLSGRHVMHESCSDRPIIAALNGQPRSGGGDNNDRPPNSKRS